MFNFLAKLNKLRRAGKVSTVTEAFNLAKQEGLEISGILEQGIRNALKIKPPKSEGIAGIVHPGVTPKKSVIAQEKINYTEMEKKLGVKLRGDETFDELKAIEKELTEPKFTKAEDNAWKYTQALWRQKREKKLEPFYKMFGAETKAHKSLIEDFIEETGDTMFIKKAKPKYLWAEIKTNIGDDLAEMGVHDDISLDIGYDYIARAFEKANDPKGYIKSVNQRLKKFGSDKKINEKFYEKVVDDLYETTVVDPGDVPFAYGGIAGILGEPTYMDDTLRVPYQHGSRQPGLETATSSARQEQQQEDIRDFQQQMADRGGGDAKEYVSQHKLDKAVDRRKKLIESFTPPGPADRHPGTAKFPVFPKWFTDQWFRKLYEPNKPWGQNLQYPYEKEEDLPEGILELLQKDPNFDLEEFLKIGWSTPENVWYDGSKGLQGIYFGGFPKGIKRPVLAKGEPPGEKIKTPLIGKRIKKVYATPSGPPSERVWDPEKLDYPTTFTPSKTFDDTINIQHNPFKVDDSPMIANPNIPTSYVGEHRSSNVDKARTVLHELRHKKFVENPELWKTQPEWVQNVEMPGTEEYYQNVDEFGRPKYMTGHELYDRFLDQRYFPPTRAGGDPYFDKILKDLWEPSAKEYERIVPRYAKGGLAKLLGE